MDTKLHGKKVMVRDHRFGEDALMPALVCGHCEHAVVGGPMQLRFHVDKEH